MTKTTQWEQLTTVWVSVEANDRKTLFLAGRLDDSLSGEITQSSKFPQARKLHKNYRKSDRNLFRQSACPKVLPALLRPRLSKKLVASPLHDSGRLKVSNKQDGTRGNVANKPKTRLIYQVRQHPNGCPLTRLLWIDNDSVCAQCESALLWGLDKNLVRSSLASRWWDSWITKVKK